MKNKIILFSIIFILIISECVCVFADEEGDITGTNLVEQTEEVASDTQTEETTYETDLVETTSTAKVVEAGDVEESNTAGVTDKTQKVTIEIIDGVYVGEEFETTYSLSFDMNGMIEAYPLEKGDKVTVIISEDTLGTTTVTIQGLVRTKLVLVMVVIFFASILVVGGKKGIRTIISILFSGIIVFLMLIRGLYNGSNAIWITSLSCIFIVVGSFLIINGVGKKTLVAALGTFGGLLVSGVFALIFNTMGKMSGAYENVIQLSANITNMNFDFKTLLFASIQLVTVGVSMDIAFMITNKLDEVKAKKSDITWKELFKEGMNIGKESLSTMTNTLLLAYIGLSLTSIMVFLACDFSILEIINRETITEQIIAALAGSLGIIYTVPLASIAYAFFNKDKVIYKKTSENRVDGRRSMKI